MSHDSAESLELAKKKLRGRQFTAAIEILTTAIESDSRNADLVECLAAAYYLSGDLDNALESFQLVTKIKPTLPKAWVNIGAIFNRQGKHHEAVRALRKGVQRDRRSAHGFYNLGIAQKGLGQLAMAATAYKDALKINPDMAEAHQNLGNVYLEMSNNRQAINSFKRALELRPNFDRAKRGLAIAENAAASRDTTANPFGRLVSTEDMAAQKAEVRLRELTDEERYDDRKTIRSLTGSSRNRARELVELLRDELEPAILHLGRAVSESDRGKDLAALFEAYQAAKTTARSAHDEIHREIEQLKAHDAKMRES